MANPKYLVRIANSDIDGEKKILYGLRRIKGVGIMLSNVICKILGYPEDKKISALSKEEIKEIETLLANPIKYGIPNWILNRRKDPETGMNTHLISNELVFLNQADIKRMKKIKCYRGVRHMHGLPVRGQRTKSNFRKNKGKVMGVTHAGKKRG
jgi:small subunit ribosomal protein S13